MKTTTNFSSCLFLVSVLALFLATQVSATSFIAHLGNRTTTTTTFQELTFTTTSAKLGNVLSTNNCTAVAGLTTSSFSSIVVALHVPRIIPGECISGSPNSTTSSIMATVNQTSYSAYASDASNGFGFAPIAYNGNLGGVVSTDFDSNGNSRIIVFKNQLANSAGKNGLNSLPSGTVLFTGNNSTFIFGPIDPAGVLFFKNSVNSTGNITAIEVDHLNGNGNLVKVGTLNPNTFQNFPRFEVPIANVAANQMIFLSGGQNGGATGNLVMISLKDGSTIKNTTLTFPDSNFTRIQQGAVLLNSANVGLILQSTNPQGGFAFGVANLANGQIKNIGPCASPCNIFGIIPRSGLSPGALAAIIIAVLVVVGTIAIIVFVVRKRRNAGTSKNEYSAVK